MSTKSRITEKGDMWEWEHSPETEEAIKQLHGRVRSAKTKAQDDQMNYDTSGK